MSEQHSRIDVNVYEHDMPLCCFNFVHSFFFLNYLFLGLFIGLYIYLGFHGLHFLFYCPKIVCILCNTINNNVILVLFSTFVAYSDLSWHTSSLIPEFRFFHFCLFWRTSEARNALTKANQRLDCSVYSVVFFAVSCYTSYSLSACELDPISCLSVISWFFF